MGSSSPSLMKRALYRCSAYGLRGGGQLFGRFFPRARTVSSYLVGLIDQGRYAEVDALVGHAARKLLHRVSSGVSTRRRAPVDAININATTQRLDADGRIVPKKAWIYPSDDADRLASVVIPCFNYGLYLEEAIASVRAQTIGSCEIIIVDDGSTDPATRAVLDRLQDDPTLRVIRQTNQGLPSARNNGIAIARGEYVCCLDADDLIEPIYLECAIAVLSSDRAAGFAYSHVRMFGDVSETWETRDFDIQQALVANHISVSAVFRRDDWHEAGGYSADMRGGFEDWEFWIRLSTLGRRGRVIAHPLFLHRRHGRTMTHDAKDRQEELHARIRSLNSDVFEDAAFRRRIGRIAPPVRDDVDDFAKLSNAVRRNDKPGLLVVVPWLRRGGAEVLMVSILRGCLADWNIVVVTTEADPQQMTENFKAVTDEIFHLHGTIDAEHRIAFMRHLVLSRAVTHVLSSGSGWFLSILPDLKSGRSADMRVANILHNEMPDSVFRAALAAGSALDRHVAVSHRVAEALRAGGLSDSQISEIANGVDPGPLGDAAAARTAVRRSYGLAPSGKVFVWIGRFAPEKRPESFVEIVSALSGMDNHRAFMVGEGPLEARTDAAIAARGLDKRITRLGHRDHEDVARLLAAADLLILTSTVEGMPLIVLEALATGCPVAATDVGDISRVVQHGWNGILVDPGTPVALADAIPEFLAAFGGDAQREALRERFSEGPYTLAAMQAAYVGMLKSL